MIGDREIGRRRGRSRLLWIACVWLVALMVAGCTEDDIALRQPPSPLPPDTDPQLVTNEWEIVEVVYQGEEVPFDAVRPFYVQWGWGGLLGFSALDCNMGSFRILSAGEHRYRLRGGVSTAVDCGELRNGQSSAVLRALRETYEYSFQDGRLWMTGEEARVVLEAVEDFPSFLLKRWRWVEVRWRWVEVRDQERVINIDEFAPIYTTYSADGWLTVEAGACWHDGFYRMYRMPASEQGDYVLRQHGIRIEGCSLDGELIAQRLVNALLATTRYELRENQLLLTGEDVQIVLEIDNPPSN